MQQKRNISSLIEKAEEAQSHAYAPYSHFKVGAAVQGESGSVYSGCNIENASYGLSICAERSAIFNAAAEGERNFHTLVVITDTDNPVAPCGACMQVMAEFNPNLEIIMATNSGRKKSGILSDFFPSVFQIPKP